MKFSPEYLELFDLAHQQEKEAGVSDRIMKSIHSVMDRPGLFGHGDLNPLIKAMHQQEVRAPIQDIIESRSLKEKFRDSLFGIDESRAEKIISKFKNPKAAENAAQQAAQAASSAAPNVGAAAESASNWKSHIPTALGGAAIGSVGALAAVDAMQNKKRQLAQQNPQVQNPQQFLSPEEMAMLGQQYSMPAGENQNAQ